MQDEKEMMKKLKPLLKSLLKGNGIRFENSSFQSFNETLATQEEYSKLTEFEKVLIHEYYLDKVKQK